MSELTAKIRQYLLENKVFFEERDHAPAQTCQESAQQRGEPIEIGGKTLLFKDKKDFRLLTLSAAKQVDSNKVRKILSSQRLRFATTEELWELTGVEKGALPPFGRPILPFDFYADRSLLENERIAFNAGILTKSFILQTKDWLKITNPIIGEFAKE